MPIFLWIFFCDFYLMTICALQRITTHIIIPDKNIEILKKHYSVLGHVGKKDYHRGFQYYKNLTKIGSVSF